VLRHNEANIIVNYQDQEIYRSGTAIFHASNLCTAVGGDLKQRIQGQRIIFEGKGPKGWNKNILLLYFSY